MDVTHKHRASIRSSVRTMGCANRARARRGVLVMSKHHVMMVSPVRRTTHASHVSQVHKDARAMKTTRVKRARSARRTNASHVRLTSLVLPAVLARLG